MIKPEVRRLFVVAAIAVFIFTPLVWMLFDREPPYTFERVTIEPPEPHLGSQIYITFHVKPGRASCGAGRVYREFINVQTKRLFVYDPIVRSAPPDISSKEFTRISVLPLELHGESIYRGTACYPCNPLHRLLQWPVCVHTPEVRFVVK